MRTLTNKNNLPETIVKAVGYDSHKVIPGALSVSALIDSPRIRMLKKKVDYSEDVSDMLYALLGTALHHVIERANMPVVRQRAFILTIETLLSEAEKPVLTEDDEKTKEGFLRAAKWLQNKAKDLFQDSKEWLTEQTLSMEVDGYLICGTFDVYHIPTKTLYDYKMCSTYVWTDPKSRAKWKAQTNVYATMLEDAGYPVEKITVVAFFRDWSSHGLKAKDYPPHQVCELNIELNPREDADGKKGRITYIKSRVKLHRDAETAEVLPLCTGTDRWATADQWAIKVKGQKKALKIAETEQECISWVQESRFKGSQQEYETEFRPGISNRCEKFCPVAPHCAQFKEIKRIQLKNSDNE